MIDLTQYQELIVRQVIEPMEIFSGFETQNQYRVSTPEGTELLYAYEESGFFGRQFMRTHRPLTLHVVDAQNQPAFTASRSFFWFYSHLRVQDATGNAIGSLNRRFRLFGRKLDLRDASGQTTAEIRGGMFRPNTFVINRNGEEVARVTKQWSGIGREMFTDADTFRVQMDTRSLEQNFATLVLAAALAIDLDFFENKGRR